MECDQCGCQEHAWSGVLGDLFHACCRACGWVYSCPLEEVSDAPDITRP
jgi:hypothetical protein